MKSFMITLVLAAVMVVSGIFCSSYIGQVAGELSERNETVSELIQRADFSAATEQAEMLSEEIEKKKIILAITLDHTELDKIETNLAELLSYSQDQQAYDAAAKCQTLHFLFRHLPKNYQLKWENIL